MKYKLCEYIDGLEMHMWTIKYKSNWGFFWNTYERYKYCQSVYYNKEDALFDIANLKTKELQSKITHINSEVIE